MKEKDAEIEYLSSQLRKKDDENTKLKAEIEKILMDQMSTLDSMKKKTDSSPLNSSDPQENN